MVHPLERIPSRLLTLMKGPRTNRGPADAFGEFLQALKIAFREATLDAKPSAAAQSG
jgi:hypothetical protein